MAKFRASTHTCCTRLTNPWLPVEKEHLPLALAADKVSGEGFAMGVIGFEAVTPRQGLQRPLNLLGKHEIVEQIPIELGVPETVNINDNWEKHRVSPAAYVLYTHKSGVCRT